MQTKLLILGLLILATTMEVTGDAIVRNGLTARGLTSRAASFLTGAVLLFGYGLTLNLAPVEFHKVVGIYIAILFIVWQIVSFVTFGSTPSPSVLIGGGLIIVGGLIVAFGTE